MHDGAHVTPTTVTTRSTTGSTPGGGRSARPPAAAAGTPHHGGPTRRAVLLAGLAGLAVPLLGCTPGSPDARATTTPTPSTAPTASSA
ncbi:hypothetical protein [Cellulomonas cellasea]|uniref:Uncharacterized protein n=2 Tax=Cellulomonas cellasea TaxID=43670 RepID=A0A0A0B6N2_9CELL|nr:hypothetical protein [Cellulomonas cellasea]KGM02470.1 hypothetical protein Q760_13130 [Cellulomonas cellasea DSM 20118]GEA86434.1 hypothetical protein CCE01nite_03830 [Cellulomonas cellasea]